jgi:hypothetical protein
VSHPVFEHDGPWTEEDYLRLRGAGAVPGGRIELIDGSLLLSPTPASGQAALVDHLRHLLAASLPAGLAVVGPVALRVAPGRILLPDLVVVTGPGDGGAVRDAADVLQVVDVVPGGRDGGPLVDRVVKPQLYAEAGIPYYLRVELDGPALAACLLIGGRYLDHVRAEPGESLRLEDPFPVTLDLATPDPAAVE